MSQEGLSPEAFQAEQRVYEAPLLRRRLVLDALGATAAAGVMSAAATGMATTIILI